MNHLISIVIPYYNRPQKLQRALDSIFNQTYSNYEIIIVDDHSKKPLTFNKENVFYTRNSKNIGPGASRNIGLKKAKGDYIVFMDSDDYWDEKFLMTCLATFKKSSRKTVMVYTNTLGFNEINICGNKRYLTIKDTKILPTILQRGRSWETSACMWDLKKIKNILWIEARNWEDYAFDVAVAVKFNDIVPINENLVYYDVCGNDKLSMNNEEIVSIEKSKSIISISETLNKSEHFQSNLLKKRIVILILNNIIALAKTDKQNKKQINKNIESLKIWKNIYFVAMIKMITSINTSIGIPLLRRVRDNMPKK